MEPALLISLTLSFLHSVVRHTSPSVSLDISSFNGSAFILYCTLIKHFAVKDQDCHRWLGNGNRELCPET